MQLKIPSKFEASLRQMPWVRGMVGAIALLALGACAPRYSSADWSAYTSKTETLRFIARSTCGSALFDPVLSENAVYFEARVLEKVLGQPWRYNVEYLSAEGWRRERFDIKQWATQFKMITAPADAWREDQRCAVVADIPRSKSAAQPYYLEPIAAKESEYQLLMSSATLVLWALLLLFPLALIPSGYGVEEFQEWAVAAGAAVLILILSSGAAGIFLRYPWSNFQAAVAYFTYFDTLPRGDGGGLLPITPGQLHYLIAGPLPPSEYQFAFEPFAWLSGILTTAWLAFVTPAVVRGIYWLITPLPLEQVHKRAMRENRAPSAEELLRAKVKAEAGKTAWQMRIMRRKADAFSLHLDSITRQL